MDQQTLQKLVSDLEAEFGIRMLIVSECSSRAWGLATKESDHDIAFMYHQLPWRKQLQDTATGIHVKRGGVDFRGHDVRRTFALACNSKLGIYEMVYSPLQYAQDALAYSTLRAVVDHYYSQRVLFDSATGHAKRIYMKSGAFDSPENVSSKDVQYITRFGMMAVCIAKDKKLQVAMHGLNPGLFSPSEYEVVCNLRNLSVNDFNTFKQCELYRRIMTHVGALLEEIVEFPERSPRPADQDYFDEANVHLSILQKALYNQADCLEWTGILK